MRDKFLQAKDYFSRNKKRSIIVLLLVLLLPLGVILALQQTVFNPRAGGVNAGMGIYTQEGDKEFGQAFPVNLSLKQAGGQSGVVGVGVVLEYDPTVLEPTNAPAEEGCIVKGPVQICQAKNQDGQLFRPFPFMPKDPVIDATAGQVSFAALSYDEAAGEVLDAYSFPEFNDFAKVYFKSKFPGQGWVSILIKENDTISDSNVARMQSGDDYLVADFPGMPNRVEFNIKDPVPFGVFSVKEVPAPGVIAYSRTLEVSGWAVSPGSTVYRYGVLLNGNIILDLPKNDRRVTAIAHPEEGVCGNTKAQTTYPDCQNGANVGYKFTISREELESGGVDFNNRCSVEDQRQSECTPLETIPQTLEVKAYSQISQGDEFEGVIDFGSLGGPKQLSFAFDDPGNKGNPATYTVTKNGNNFVVNIKPQRERGTYPYVGLIINGDTARPKRLELVSDNPVEFKWDSSNSYDGQTFQNGIYTVRLYAHCEYNFETGIQGGVPKDCSKAGIVFEPYSFQL